MIPRPQWDESFFAVAKVWAERSTCIRRKVGAVLVQGKHIIAAGYNGSPRGLPHCTDTGYCLRQQLNIPSGERAEICRATHGEMNALIQAGLYGSSTRGATLYCTTFPCAICAKAILNAEIVEVRYLEPYPDDLAAELFSLSGACRVTYCGGTHAYPAISR